MKIQREDWALFLNQVFVGVAFGLWSYILPIHVKNLGATPSQVGLVLASAGLTVTLTLVPAGLLADRYSRKRLTILFTLIPVIPTLLLSLVNTWQITMLLLIPVWLQAPNIAVINTYLAHAKPKEALGRVFALLNFGFIIGELLMRTLGARIAEQNGMGVVFQLSALAFIIAAIPLFFVKRQPSGPPKNWSGYGPLLKNRTFISISLLSMMVFFALRAGQALVPNYVQDVIGLGLSSIGQLGTLTALGGAILSLLLGRLSSRKSVIGAQFFAVIAMILILTAPVGFGFSFGFFLLGSNLAIFALLEAFMGSSVPTHYSGLAFGVQGTLIGLGNTLGALLAGVLYGQSPRYPLLLSIVGLCFMIIFTLRIPRPAVEEVALKDPPIHS